MGLIPMAKFEKPISEEKTQLTCCRCGAVVLGILDWEIHKGCKRPSFFQVIKRKISLIIDNNMNI